MGKQASPKIILFDGYCNLCSRTVQFILKRDRFHQFKFASLQGEFGKQALGKSNISSDELQSFILIQGRTYYTQSTGALMVVRSLSGLWPILYFFILVPKFCRDPIYKWVAANRYWWFGKRETCWLPSKEHSSRFIEEFDSI